MKPDRTRWIVPLLLASALLGGAGLATLVSRFRGGLMSEGLLRHASWMIVALAFGLSFGCVAQALEWRRAAAGPETGD